VVNALEGLGYVADASYPMFFHEERLAPYHLSRADWTQEGALRLLEIPAFADMAMDSQDEFGRDRDQWPLFRTEGAGSLLTHIECFLRYLEIREVRPPVLWFYFHPWEFVDIRQVER